jgi:hypothetical protein
MIKVGGLRVGVLAGVLAGGGLLSRPWRKAYGVGAV